jgi:glycogen debranching enzyme
VSHSDGRLAEAPIALCEVQAYVYGARRSAARLAVALGLPGRAAQLELAAGDLRDRFEQAFWDDELGMYVLALDGDKRPCRVRSSNAGQVLFTGIAGADRARATAQALLGPEMFSGWGIRTLGTVESRYNPMSYHNGSVWPHDNALVAAGFSRYGRQEDAARVMTGLFDAALFLDQQRLPELFCGFARRAGQGPTQYPVACSPQAWASASAFLLLQACLGLSVDALERKVVLRYPYLPEFLPELEIRNLRVGDASVDLRLDRHPFSVGVNVMRREGQVEIVAIK